MEKVVSNITPLVSIIIPIYNSEKTLHRCIGSILSQTFENWELLLINDGSEDNSGIICDEYARKDVRIRVFHKQNGGVSSARNLGLDNANGEWVTFVDSDDWVFDNWLNNFINEIKRGLCVDFIMQGFMVDKPLWNDKSNKEIYYRRSFGVNYIGDVSGAVLLMYRNAIMGYLWIKIFRQDIIKNNGIRFDCRFTILEDEEFCLRYLEKCNKVSLIDKIGYFYNVPDWGKYKRKFDDFYLFESLYKSSVSIFKGNDNILSSSYLSMFTDTLLFSYLNNDIDKKKKLKEYKLELGRNILNFNIFWLTRYVVYFDSSTCIADLLLNIHARLKKNRIKGEL